MPLTRLPIDRSTAMYLLIGVLLAMVLFAVFVSENPMIWGRYLTSGLILGGLLEGLSRWKKDMMGGDS